jgi:lipopolysaccharide export system protein LptC
MMTGNKAATWRAVGSQANRELAAVWPSRPVDRSRSRLAADRYSRWVALLKRVLPGLGLTLLALVAVWPRLGPLLEVVRLGFPVIDLREARELRMLNPRYAGLDRFNRPYVITSQVGRQVPSRDDLMSLERPRAEMMMRRGATVVVTAATAMYQSQTQLLDLFEDVNLIHENGTRFVTQRAHADLSANTAEGNDPVVGHGPSGDIAAQGFRILDKGDTIVFTGHTELLLKGPQPNTKPATPAALPAEVAAAAAQIEAAATAPAVAASEPFARSKLPDEPAHAQPAAKPLPAKPRSDAEMPGGSVPAGTKGKPRAG